MNGCIQLGYSMGYEWKICLENCYGVCRFKEGFEDADWDFIGFGWDFMGDFLGDLMEDSIL